MKKKKHRRRLAPSCAYYAYQFQDKCTGLVGSTPQNFIEDAISRRGVILYNDQTDSAAGSDKTVRLNAVKVNVTHITRAKIMHVFFYVLSM